MTRILSGERIGRSAKLRVGCSAVIFDAEREKILLTQREDNKQWCLPGGAMEPGESASEACIREVYEETGLQAQVTRLMGIYTSPHEIIEYKDGNRVQSVSLCFEAEITGGVLGVSDETTAYGYFSKAEVASLDVLPTHQKRIVDAFSGETATFIK